jgi:hypothetical protein
MHLIIVKYLTNYIPTYKPGYAFPHHYPHLSNNMSNYIDLTYTAVIINGSSYLINMNLVLIDYN